MDLTIASTGLIIKKRKIKTMAKEIISA